MYLKQSKRGGRVYLSVAQNYRQNGTVHTRTVESLGYVDQLSARFADPVAHFKEYVAQLNEQQAQQSRPVEFSVARDAVIQPGHAAGVSLGAAIALAYLDVLGIGSYFGGGKDTAAQGPAGEDDAEDQEESVGESETVTKPETMTESGTDSAADAGRAFELLANARMLHAVPIHDTWSARGKFPRPVNFTLADVHAWFTRYAQSAPQLAAHLNAVYERIRGERALDNVLLVFSDCVFPWTERPQAAGPDEAAVRTRARLVLAIDGEGIPLAYRIVPRDLDAPGIVSLLDQVKEEVVARSMTLIAAQLPDAAAVLEQVLAHGDGFVLLQQAASMPADLAAWAADSADYHLTNNRLYRMKSRRTRLAGSAVGRQTVEVKEIALQPATSDNDGNREQSSAPTPSFCLVSSMVNRSDAQIFNLYRERWRVHEPFQVIAADFIAAPVDARTHLRAHFAVCYTAFFALRLLRQDMDWAYNAAQVADALVRMEGAYLDQNWFLFNYRTPVTDAIQQAAGMDVGRRILSRGDIRHAVAAMKRQIARFRSR